MKLMLDASPRKLAVIEAEYDVEVLQLRTPLTQYAVSERLYGLDNGSFTKFSIDPWFDMAVEGFGDPRCLWITMPDIVGNWERTLELFHHWRGIFEMHECDTRKAAIVLQDGCSYASEVPWDEIDCVFIGGSDQYKRLHTTYDLCVVAMSKSKWVHVGRVNSPSRIMFFEGVADSFDGSALVKYSHMLEAAVSTLRVMEAHPRCQLDIDLN